MVLPIPPESVRLSVDDGRVYVPGTDIIRAKTTTQAGKPMDEGEIVLDNSDPYPYTTDTPIGVGDKIHFQRTTDHTTGFGTDPYGEGAFGDTRTIGTYLVQDWDCIEHAPGEHELVLNVSDYVYSILNNRVVFFQRSGKPLSGTQDAILNKILKQNAPEVNRAQLPTVSFTTDYYSNGKPLRDVVAELTQYIAYLDEPVIDYGLGETLILRRTGEITPKYDTPMEGDFGLWNTASESDKLVNQVRITGGLDTDNIDDQQTTHSGTATVSSSNRLITQLSTRKSEITKLELYTKGPSDPTNGPQVRLQVSNAAGDGPIAPGDPDSDVASTGIQNVDLNADDWSMFHLGDHTLPERAPWLIVDTDGSTGYDIGTDGSGVPAYVAHFPKRLAAQIPAPGSIEQNTLIEEHIKNKSLVTQQAVKSRAYSFLERHADLPQMVGPLECVTDDAHNIDVGEAVTFDRPEMRVSDDFLAVKKTSVYETNTLSEQIEFRGISNYV